MQGVHQKILSGPPPLKLPVDGQAPEKCCRDDRIPREFLRHILRPSANIHADGREGVETQNCIIVPLAQHKSRGHVFPRILSRLYLKVFIEWLAAAGKP